MLLIVTPHLLTLLRFFLKKMKREKIKVHFQYQIPLSYINQRGSVNRAIKLVAIAKADIGFDCRALLDSSDEKYYILVYLEDLRAKIYKLDGKSYDKVGNFSNENYSFNKTTCNITIDFEKLFKRFKR